MAYAYKRFAYKSPPGLSGPEPRHKVVVVGAGPIGLALAIELANHGVGSVVLDDNDMVSAGSRAICWSKRSLEILDRLGVGDRCVEKGVTWKMGRTFRGEQEVFNFDLLPEGGHKMPAFVNLQQYYVEEFLIERAQGIDLIDLRFRNRVESVSDKGEIAEVGIATPDGHYALQAQFVVACDGANSAVRGMLGLEFEGELFEERFLIADIEMQADFPAERWFWFEPTFHNGQSALLHKQPDNIYRIDLQLGWDADPEVEKLPENVVPRIQRVVGHGDFRLDWVSVYTFQCRRLREFVHNRVVFAGDSAHVVSPFGARGGNGGLQDVDNLGWKLAAVVQKRAPATLLHSYDRERVQAADENILNSTRTTRFMTPADGPERVYRDAVLKLATKTPFACAWVNSGRLSRPCRYSSGGPDDPQLPSASRPGEVSPDAPIGDHWLLNDLGKCCVLLSLGQQVGEIAGAQVLTPKITPEIRDRYLGDADAAIYLIRPDQVVSGRWLSYDAQAVSRAIAALWEGRI
ncbi:MAG: FAD-dependent monooxygenase [Paracoccaceae bacterium]